MGIELIFITLSLGAVLLTRGSFTKLFRSFSHVWILGLAIAGHLIIEFVPIKENQYDTVGLGILLFTYVMLFGFCCANLNLRGMWIVLTGIACNAFVIGLNKGMPVTTSGDFTVEESIKHQARTSIDLLPWLADVIPVNFLSMAISVGDIIFGIGVVYMMIAISRRDKTQDAEDLIVLADKDDEEITMETVMTEAALSKKALSMSGVLDNDEYIDIREDEIKPDKSKEVTPAPMTVPAQDASSLPVATSPKIPKRSTEKIAPAVPGRAKERSRASRKSRKWHEKHGLSGLPSKEELGFDEGSMTVVDSAE